MYAGAHRGRVDAGEEALGDEVGVEFGVIPHEPLPEHPAQLRLRLEGRREEGLLVKLQPEALLGAGLRRRALAAVPPRQQVG